jgi:predicted ArsR family transcriptional regulator
MSSDDIRRPLHDPRALRALTHPIRLSLLELLDREGPLTATEAGELIGESPASCSFHLRTLAKYGFVEEAAGGRGRQRPWQVKKVISTITDTELSPEARLAAQAFVDLMRQRQQEWLRRWDTARGSYATEWRDAATEMHTVLHLTAAELAALTEVMSEATLRYADRDDPGQRPVGTVPVSLTVQAFPLSPPSKPTDTPSTEES